QFERDGADVAKVAAHRHEIVGERGGEDLPVRVVHDLVKEHATESLHQRTDRLAVDDGRIDGAADILDCNIVDDLHAAGGGVDGDVTGMRAVTVGAGGGREAAFGREPGERRKCSALVA